MTSDERDLVVLLAQVVQGKLAGPAVDARIDDLVRRIIQPPSEGMCECGGRLMDITSHSDSYEVTKCSKCDIVKVGRPLDGTNPEQHGGFITHKKEDK